MFVRGFTAWYTFMRTMSEITREVPVSAPERPNEAEPAREAESVEAEQSAASAEKPVSTEPVSQVPTTAVAPALPTAKDATLIKVERVLEDNLSDIYFELPEPARAAFKAEGEKTASMIRTLIDTSKITAKTVLDLVRKWLKLIPHVNKYFLQQESKIKTDRIMAMAEKQKNDM